MVLKYPRLTKFIQKNYSNTRMPSIFLDSLGKTAFLHVFSRNIMARQNAVYSKAEVAKDNIRQYLTEVDGAEVGVHVLLLKIIIYLLK